MSAWSNTHHCTLMKLSPFILTLKVGNLSKGEGIGQGVANERFNPDFFCFIKRLICWRFGFPIWSPSSSSFKYYYQQERLPPQHVKQVNRTLSDCCSSAYRCSRLASVAVIDRREIFRHPSHPDSVELCLPGSCSWIEVALGFDLLIKLFHFCLRISTQDVICVSILVLCSPPPLPFYLHDTLSHALFPSLLHISSTYLSISLFFVLSHSSIPSRLSLHRLTLLSLFLVPVYKPSELTLLGNSNTLISCKQNMLAYRTRSLH